MSEPADWYSEENLLNNLQFVFANRNAVNVRNAEIIFLIIIFPPEYFQFSMTSPRDTEPCVVVACASAPLAYFSDHLHTTVQQY